MTDHILRTVTRTSGANAALKDGTVQPRGFALTFEEVPVLVQAFRRMVRGLEFDVCEMAITTYLVAKAHGVRMTALPIFLVRGFHHGATQVLAEAGIRDPAALEGRRVGVNRGYTVTTGVWARSFLAAEHGVNLDRVTWVLSGDEHVEAFRPPANVVPKSDERSLEELLRADDLAAVIGADLAGTDIAPLLPKGAGADALRDRGLFPINHLVVVRDELLNEHPTLAGSLFDCFAEAKEVYVRRLRRGDVRDAADQMYADVMRITGSDPLPYGIKPNRSVLEELMRAAVDQHILAAPVPLEELFAVPTLQSTT